MFTARRGRLIVSCQPGSAKSPLNSPQQMAAMAQAAEAAGATALRVNSPEHVVAVKAVTRLPVIGLWKQVDARGQRVITPDLASAQSLVAAGADLIAVEATAEAHPVPGRLAMLIRGIHEELGRPVMADISTLAEGVRATGYGADLVGTTLSGYTPYSPQQAAPDLMLVQELARAVSVPVVAEGRYTSPEQCRAALQAGAAFVVVGNALTAPDVSVARFVAQMEPEAGPLTAERYWAEAAVAIARMQATQGPAIREAAALCARVIGRGGVVHLCGAEGLLAEVAPQDLVIIWAESGQNEGLVALAHEAKRRGNGLIVIASADQAAPFAYVADVVIDNGAPAGDAILTAPGLVEPVCAVSSVTGALIVQALAAESIRLIEAAGIPLSGSDLSSKAPGGFPNVFTRNLKKVRMSD